MPLHDDAEPTLDRRARRRLATQDEILDAALVLMAEDGVAGLSITRLAAATSMKPPSLYRYYPSLMAIYDTLFRCGQQANLDVVRSALASSGGLAGVAAAMTAAGRWAVDNPVLAQLLFWRPVPGYKPSPDAFAPAAEIVALLQTALAQAATDGQIGPGAATDEGMNLLSTLHFGVLTQHLSNDVGSSWDDGRYTRMHPRMIDMFVAAYPPAGRKARKSTSR